MWMRMRMVGSQAEWLVVVRLRRLVSVRSRLLVTQGIRVECEVRDFLQADRLSLVVDGECRRVVLGQIERGRVVVGVGSLLVGLRAERVATRFRLRLLVDTKRAGMAGGATMRLPTDRNEKKAQETTKRTTTGREGGRERVRLQSPPSNRTAATRLSSAAFAASWNWRAQILAAARLLVLARVRWLRVHPFGLSLRSFVRSSADLAVVVRSVESVRRDNQRPAGLAHPAARSKEAPRPQRARRGARSACAPACGACGASVSPSLLGGCSAAGRRCAAVARRGETKQARAAGLGVGVGSMRRAVLSAAWSDLAARVVVAAVVVGCRSCVPPGALAEEESERGAQQKCAADHADQREGTRERGNRTRGTEPDIGERGRGEVSSALP